MPVAPQASQHSSLFSSIRRAIQSSSPHNSSAVAPDPPTPTSHPLSFSSSSSSSSSTLSSSSHDPHRLQLYDVFESNLVQRLSSLLPVDDSTCVNLASLKQFLQVLLDTQADLMPLMPSHQLPLSQAQSRMMEEFLERSVKLLDVCRAIKEQISNVESSQGMLHLVLSCLSSKNRGVLHTSQVARAQRALGEVLHHMEGDEEIAPSVNRYRSFRLKCNNSSPDAPQRRRSWHGSARSSVQPNMSSSRQLHALGSVLTIPRLTAGDVEENFCAAIYTLNILSIFFLGTLSSSLPSLSKTYVTSFTHPRSFPWASPLTHLQEKVQEELKCRGRKSNGYVGVWELDQIATIVKRLFELTEGEDFSLGDKAREEIKNLVKQLRQHVEEVDREMGLLYAQLMIFYGRIISSRMAILDALSEI